MMIHSLLVTIHSAAKDTRAAADAAAAAAAAAAATGVATTTALARRPGVMVWLLRSPCGPVRTAAAEVVEALTCMLPPTTLKTDTIADL